MAISKLYGALNTVSSNLILELKAPIGVHPGKSNSADKGGISDASQNKVNAERGHDRVPLAVAAGDTNVDRMLTILSLCRKVDDTMPVPWGVVQYITRVESYGVPLELSEPRRLLRRLGVF